MLRKIIFAGTMLFAVSAVANPVFPVPASSQSANQCVVASDTMPNFCDLFKSAVTSCSPVKLPMQGIYRMMIAVYGTLQNACVKQAARYGSDPQTCIDQWNCYWNGGKDSKGGLCSATGNKCDQL